MARRRGQFSDLGYPVTKMLAHTLAPAVDAADFRRSRNGDGAEAAAAHSLRALRRDCATAQAECLPCVSGRTDICWRGMAAQL
jgi:hypothetical protein